MCELLEKGVRKNTMLRCKKYRNMHISSYFEKKKNVQCEKNKKHNTYSKVPVLGVAIFVDACIAETISIWHLGSVTGFLILILKTQIATHYVWELQMCGRQIAK